MDFVWDSIWFVGCNVTFAYISHTDGIWEGFWALPKADRFWLFGADDLNQGSQPWLLDEQLVVISQFSAWWFHFFVMFHQFPSIQFGWFAIDSLVIPRIAAFFAKKKSRTRNIWKKEIETTQAVFCASRICISTAVRGDPCRSPQWRSRRVRSCATARCEDLPDSGWRKPLEIWRLNTNRNSIPCQNMYYY